MTTITRRSTRSRGKTAAVPNSSTSGHAPPQTGLPRQFAESALAVLQVDLRRRIRYANDSAVRMLGIAKPYEGIVLDDLFTDKDSLRTLLRELRSRREGAIGNYRLAGTRKSDGKAVQFEVTGLPLFSKEGKVVGSLGIFRNLDVESVARQLDDLGRRVTASSEEIFNTLAQALHRLFSFEMMFVGRYSGDFHHSKSFSIVGERAPRTRERRWWRLNEGNRKSMSAEGVSRIMDLRSYLKQPDWREIHDDPDTQAFLDAGFRTALRRDVKRDNRPIGSFSLMSKSADAFTEEHERMLAALPIEPLIAAAFEASDRKITAGKLELLKKLNNFREVTSACQAIADDLVDIFDWSHVSIFQVRHGRQKVHMLAQCSNGKPRIVFAEGHEEPIERGILGRVVKDGRTQNIPDVSMEKEYVKGTEEVEVRSELAVPVKFEGDARVRFIINVEDVNEAAFSSDEQSALEELAREISRSLQRISELYFLTECFQKSSDAVIVVDSQAIVRTCNRAAGWMLGFRDESQLKGHGIGEIFQDPLEFDRKWHADDPELGEITVVRIGEADPATADAPPSSFPASVSRSFLPDAIGGAVLMLRDVRDIQKRAETQTLSRAAYTVAVETSTYALAASGLVSSAMKRCPDDARGDLEQALSNISRVRDAYSRLAAFHSGADRRPQLSRVDLAAELRALVGDLPADDQEKVDLESEPGLPKIVGDYYPLRIVFDTLITPLIRCAPEDGSVQLRLKRGEGKVTASITGNLLRDGSTAEVARNASEAGATAGVAMPYIAEVMDHHSGKFDVRDGVDGTREYILEFPKA